MIPINHKDIKNFKRVLESYSKVWPDDDSDMFIQAAQIVTEPYPTNMNVIIAAVQMIVNKKFHSKIKVDGYYGPVTKEKVLRFLRKAKPRPNHTPIARGKVREHLHAMKAWREMSEELPSQSTTALTRYYGSALNIRRNYGKFITHVKAPYPIYYAGVELKRGVSCHVKVAKRLEAVFYGLHTVYAHSIIHELGLDQYAGGYFYRPMKGRMKRLSTHSYGIATDWHPAKNAFRKSFAESVFSDEAYLPWLEIWYSQGAINLGVEYDFDSMHMQFTRGY